MATNSRPSARSVLHTEVGERLRVGRIARGFSQETLGLVLGRTKGQISELEVGKNQLNYNDLVALDSLGLKAGYILCNRLSDLSDDLQDKVIEAKSQGYERVPKKWKRTS